MIEAIIRAAIANRFLVLLATAITIAVGLMAVKNTPVDAIPDLSDVQVIIKTRYPGQAPKVVEDQVTYPLTTALLSVPGAKTVRGFSFYGDSYIYVIFDDDTDLYWARARVLEYLNQVTLPSAAKPQLGPDATGVGWVYLYALSDPTGQYDLAQLRSLQDWFLKYELQTVPGVAEVATVGGMVKQYQVEVDPLKLRAFNIPLAHIHTAITNANQEVGASVVEMAEAEYMVRATGYIQTIADLETIPLGINNQGTPLLLKDIADVRTGPAQRRAIAELNGQGETVGGVVVMRFGENAQQTIDGVKQKLASLTSSLPAGVEITPVYDRSHLIQRAVQNLWHKLAEEIGLVALVCAVFLLHLRSSLVAIISLPVAILIAFIVMQWQGVNANIMSLGGIAIAVGAMIDGAIVMIENLHKHCEQTPLTKHNRWQVVSRAAQEVGPSLFFSLLIITVSFVPVFALEAQEGRMFSPLAYTKTYAMAAAAVLAITLVPVLMGYFVRGNILPENKNPVNKVLLALYRPVLRAVLHYPKTTVALSLLVLASSWWPLQHLGSEFIPDLDEGDLMYMPSTYPGVSIGQARQILQQTDKLIKTLPEVDTVFGKIGRANTATDPAPLTMIETFIQFKPQSQWRAGKTKQDLIDELNQRVQLPGLTNAWVQPIKTRIDMLATGIKTPLGIKVAGPDINQIQTIGKQIEHLLADIPGTASVYSERVASGRYLTLDINRLAAARYNVSVAEIQTFLASAIGGISISESVEGLERYPINVRYPQQYRDSPEAIAQLPMVTQQGIQITLGDVATISVDSGPPILKSENARLNGWTLVDIKNRDLGGYVAEAQQMLAQQLTLPAGYSLTWAGQYEYLARAKAKFTTIIPITLAIIVVLLYLNFRSFTEVAILIGTFPLALVGSVWLMYGLDFNFSVAVAVGMIALAGVAIETGIIMLVFLKSAMANLEARDNSNRTAVEQALAEGASRRLRPVMMTAIATIAGLVPVLFGSGTGSEVMSRLAAPMVGGMLTTLLLTLLLLPAIYSWRYQRGALSD
ncbi:efflux RND transporter permease subunit [Halioxenophilus aromaticivorans]|uniref:CusA/CzcA family heavy metal efflux RND transporter n=1 Tax=Halioxenophilus aromaticivorans TaxID=1306992 RepID=A0AAV3U1T4_9ALTE